MTDTLVDSSIWLDIVTRDAQWLAWSRGQLEESQGRGRLNQIVLAEIAAAFADAGASDAIGSEYVERRNLPWEASILAGEAHRAYRRGGGERTAILPDFLIAAHAAFEGLTLLTRDPHRVAGAFSNLKIIAP